MAQDMVEVLTFKGFSRDMTCRNFVYKIGETYTMDGEIKACSSGFHGCEYPLDVFTASIVSSI